MFVCLFVHVLVWLRACVLFVPLLLRSLRTCVWCMVVGLSVYLPSAWAFVAWFVSVLVCCFGCLSPCSFARVTANAVVVVQCGAACGSFRKNRLCEDTSAACGSVLNAIGAVL